MSKPRIIFSSFDSPGHPVYGGGGARSIHEVSKRLASQFEVKVIAGAYPKAKNGRVDGVEYEFVGPRTLKTQLAHIFFHCILPWKIQREKFDLWVENFTPPFSTTCLPLFTRKPVIGLVHMLSGEDMKRKYKLPFQKIEQLGIRAYQYVIVTSQYFQNIIRQHNHQTKITIIPNGFGLEPTNQKPTHSGPYLLYLGRIEINQKGLDLLLQAFAKVAEKIPHQLIIAGAGAKQEEKQFATLIKQHGLENRVTRVGRVEGETKTLLLQHATAVVVPSRFETFGLAALEALGSKKTVVCFNIPQLSWIPDAVAYKVKAFEVPALSAGILTAVSNVTERKSKELQAVEFAKQFTWETIAHKYAELFRAILNTAKFS